MLRTVNLNLFPVLQALLRDKSVSRAARRLHLTQPAVSIALAKLRLEFDDPLLVQVGREMELTPRARALIGPVEHACAAMELALAPPRFAPESAIRTFVMATFDYSALVVGPRMIKSLARIAPGITMHFVNLSPKALEESLAHVDIMFLPKEAVRRLRSEDLHHQFVLRDEIVYMVGPGNPLYHAPEPGLKELQSQRTIRFSPRYVDAASADSSLFGFHLSPPFTPAVHGHEIALTEQFSLAPLMALLSGSVCEAPRRLIEALQEFVPLRIFEAGLAPVEVFAAWRAVHDADPGHQWFRQLLVETIGDDRFAIEQ